MRFSRRTLVHGSALAIAGAAVGGGRAKVARAQGMRLPQGFRWGVASPGFQSEGYAPDSNWVRYGASSTRPKRLYRDSVDFFRRFRQDVELAAGLGGGPFPGRWTRG
ncbi:hypothetical protein [Nocardia callitridis]|uniref:Uncharacterized protein n=1 Tax=Nocardia callitridis TaxID=648753 RepID=A0ABP9KEQ8_9NOCA